MTKNITISTSEKEEKKCDCEDECGGDYFDIFSYGNLIDDHIDADVSEEEIAKKYAAAMQAAKQMGYHGNIPGGMEDEIGDLIKPKVSCKDILKMKLHSIENGLGKSDWTKPRLKQLAAGLYTPKQQSIFANILVGCDTSGSMGQDDMALGVSQIQAVQGKAKAWFVSWDTQVYWDKAVRLDKLDISSLSNLKAIGRGGTSVNHLFNSYKEHIGEVDLIIVITDSGLSLEELKECKVPKKTQVIWMITENNRDFAPHFGRVINLRD